MSPLRVSTLRAVAIASFVLVAPIQASVAQGHAHELRHAAGFDIDSVTDGGRYISLRNGTVWEVEISDRATSAAWTREDFVGLHRIWAPRENYEFQLTRVGMGEQRVAARLAGRQAAAYRSDSTSTHQE